MGSSGHDGGGGGGGDEDEVGDDDTDGRGETVAEALDCGLG